jgi:spermidine/putrescine transport system permease protein
MRRSIFAAPYAVWMAMFTIMPVVYHRVCNTPLPPKNGAYSLTNWADFFTAGNLRTVWVSITSALQCTAICLIVGYPAAYFLASKEFSLNKTLFVLILLPMWMNLPSAHLCHARAAFWTTGVINTLTGHAGL